MLRDAPCRILTPSLGYFCGKLPSRRMRFALKEIICSIISLVDTLASLTIADGA